MSLCYKIREEVDAAWTKEGLIVMRRPGTDGYDPLRTSGRSACRRSDLPRMTKVGRKRPDCF